ncbi:MAG: carboxypeptidase-like regulatory domain-containing protein [Anaerolineae bacterium]|nr:carboxypeptidase-like regulatory domain-containing protein [Anaerolineae bacterium]
MAAHRISGTIRDQNGKPVAGARVYFTSSPVSLPDIAALTDADGTFIVTVPVSGDYTLAAAAGDTPPTAFRVTVGVAEETRLEIRINR